jgi:iron complex transport system substrate-binding protein
VPDRRQFSVARKASAVLAAVHIIEPGEPSMSFKTIRPARGAVLTSVAAAALSIALPFGTAKAEATQYPLTFNNCGRAVTFERAPTRAVSIGQSSTEILYLLGVADRVIGTAVWIGPVIAGYEDVNAKVERLADNDPSFESVVSKKPDLVTAQFQWHVGPEGIVAKPEQFEELKIPVYTSPADCIGKDNTGGGDGVRNEVFSMELIYQEVSELAQIFDVQDRGDELIAELKAREEAARKKIASADGKLSAVFWFSSAELDIDPYVAGRKGAPGYIMSALGIRNVIESDEEWPTVGWETVAKADPTIIVAGKMERRRFPADDVAVKHEFLKSDPVASLMPAVKNGHIVDMDAQAMNPTIRTIEGIEVLAEAVAKAGLGQ